MRASNVPAIMAKAERAGRLVAGGAAAVSRAHDEMTSRGKLRAALSLAGDILDLMDHGAKPGPQKVEIIDAEVIEAEAEPRRRKR
jgi:hypothetical protein